MQKELKIALPTLSSSFFFNARSITARDNVLEYFLFVDDHFNFNPWTFFSCFGLLEYILKIE